MSRAAGWPLLVAAGPLALLANTAPLWTYALSLALFGLPHVLVELRYVDARFTARTPRPLRRWLGLSLLAIVGLRLAALGGWTAGGERARLELLVGLAAVLAVVVTPHTRPGAVVAWATAVALAAGTWWAPSTTLVVLALLHNLTPIGFLAERLPPSARWRGLLTCAVVFGLVPAAMPWLQPAAPFDPGPGPLGELADHLPAFVPAPWLDAPWAETLFAIAAYLQCQHYVAVLTVLPRLGGGTAATGAGFAWPRTAAFVGGVVATGGVATFGFLADFAGTRSSYAVVAALHAWLEIPILLLAVGRPAEGRS